MGGGEAGGGDAVREVAGIKLLLKAVSGIDAKDLKSIVDDKKKSIGSGVVAIANASPQGAASVVVGVTADLTQRINAVDLVRLASEKLGGKGGGGRPDMAQAGGPDATAINSALTAIENALKAKAAE
jgi:alanyl-tRNA synthetase